MWNPQQSDNLKTAPLILGKSLKNKNRIITEITYWKNNGVSVVANMDTTALASNSNWTLQLQQIRHIIIIFPVKIVPYMVITKS